jgi:GAF domain-containing protein
METKLSALYELGQRLILLHDPLQIVETVLDIAVRVLDLQDSDFLLVDEGRRELYVAARRGLLQDADGLRLPLDGDQGITVVAARMGQPVYVPDVRQDPRYVYTGFSAASELAVPVLIEGRVLGVLNVESAERDAFSTADQELLSALASQAALALENARLYAEERRRAEEMAILNELARRISASLDLQATLEAIVAAAAELIPCDLAEVSLWDEGAQLLTLLALHCDPDRTYPVGRSFPPGEGYTGWMVRHHQPLLVPDVNARHDIHPHLLPGEKPFQAYAGLPLLLGEMLVGTLVLVADQPGAFDQRDMRLLQTLAHHAVTAIHNAQLFDETQRQARRLAALNAVASVINQPLPLQQMMDQALATVIEVMDTDAGGIRLYDPATGEMVLAAFQGLGPEEIQRTQRLNLGEGYGERLAQFREPLVLGDLKQVPELADIAGYGFDTHAYVPVIVKGGTIGVLGVIAQQQRALDSEELDLLTAIGNQIGVAIENDRLRQMALETERLAAVGRVATSVAHDLRSPLGGILRSAEFLARPELSPDTRAKLSQSVISLARRLIHTTQGILDYVRREKLPLRRLPCRLSEFLDEVLPVLDVDFSDQGIEVVRQCNYQGEVVMDADRIAHVVYNIAANARDAMPRGGTFTVATRQNGEQVELRFSDTGPGVPEELRDRVFEPFFTYGKREGAGLGLSIARRIVEEHGGKLWIEGAEEGGATFVLSLPL